MIVAHFTKRTSPLTSGKEAAFLKKEDVLLYAIAEIGETRDAKRLPISENDLPALIKSYRMHTAGAPVTDSRAKSVCALDLFQRDSINIRHHWPSDEARNLGLLGSEEDPVAVKAEIDTTVSSLRQIAEQWEKGGSTLVVPPSPTAVRKIVLEDVSVIPTKNKKKKKIQKELLFSLRIGKRVLKKDIHQIISGVPLYSANVRKHFGFVKTANAGELEFGGVLWSIDSDFDCRPVSPGEAYSITDHCGQLQIHVPGIDPAYFAAQIRQAGLDYGFNREFRPSLEMIGKLEIELPLDSEGNFDLPLMEEWSRYRMELDRFKQEMLKLLEKQ